jgi:DNA invertase Pin-like site-specific DNA recombinase
MSDVSRTVGSNNPILVAPILAAQYVRMSTENQKYSIANQIEAISSYAATRGYRVVQTYADEGRSGLKLEGRDALKQLITHVRSGQAEYSAILVFDISRWGRFQDADESAYYEFICKEAGIKVHYCAEQFENDGSLPSFIMKSVKRAMAGEFSRDLSNKVFIGQCRSTRMGFWPGGVVGFGLRRVLIDTNGVERGQLEFRQRKFLQTDRVILRHGPASEVQAIRRAFEAFVVERKSMNEIAAELNASQIRTTFGNLWTPGSVDNILRNERYVGSLIYNRRSFKLKQPLIHNPPEMWVRNDTAIEPMISRELFVKAQELRTKRIVGRSNKDGLNALKELWHRKGHLSRTIIREDSATPCPLWYRARFGSLVEAYRLIGFPLKGRYNVRDRRAHAQALLAGLTRHLAARIRRLNVDACLSDDFRHMSVNGKVISIVIARAAGRMSGKTSRQFQWSKVYRSLPSDLVLIIQMNELNSGIDHYYVVPTGLVEKELKTDFQFCIKKRVFGHERRYTNLTALARELADRAKTRR